MDTGKLRSFILVYIACSAGCFILHYFVEYKYYHDCRKDLFTVFGAMVSPYCHALRRLSSSLEYLPVNVMKKGFQTVFAPLIQTAHDGFFEGI
jgi:hypothetical protein